MFGIVPVPKRRKKSESLPFENKSEVTGASADLIMNAYDNEAGDRREETQATSLTTLPEDALASEPVAQGFIHGFGPDSYPADSYPADSYQPGGPEDYMASSEALLESLAEDDSLADEENESHPWLDGIFTPVGVGSLLLLLLSSATLGYMVMNPSMLGNFSFRWGQRSGSEVGDAPSTSTDQGSETGEIGVPRSGPDLSAQEFY